MQAFLQHITTQRQDPNTLIKYIKDRGWFTSPNTLYGSKSKPGIMQNLLNKGLARLDGSCYVLADIGLKWVDSDIIMSGQTDKLGSEEHKQLIRKTIKMLQNELHICLVNKEKYSFDILAIPFDAKKHGIWDVGRAKGYEIQSSARKDSIMENMEKSKLWGIPMVWVTDNRLILDEIIKLTDNLNEYRLIG